MPWSLHSIDNGIQIRIKANTYYLTNQLTIVIQSIDYAEMTIMPGTRFFLPKPENESILEYLPGSPERIELKAKLIEMKATTLDIPLIIDGKEVRTGKTRKSHIPHDHEHLLAEYHNANEVF